MMKSKIKMISGGVVMLLSFFLIGCSESKSGTADMTESGDSVQIKKSAPQETIKNSQEPLYKNEPLVALELCPVGHEPKYDADGPVMIRAELFSPRTFAMLDHNHYRTPDEESADLPQAMIGKGEKPWWRELKLTVTGNGINGEVPFFTIPSVVQETIDLGNGEVGSVRLILEEGIFPMDGKYHVKAHWKGGKYGTVSSEELPIILVKDHLNETDRDLLRFKVMLARGENSTSLQMMKKLAESKPDSYRIRYNLGEAYEKNNNLKEALAQYQHALILFHRVKPVEPHVGLLFKIKTLIGKGIK